MRCQMMLQILGVDALPCYSYFYDFSIVRVQSLSLTTDDAPKLLSGHGGFFLLAISRLVTIRRRVDHGRERMRVATPWITGLTEKIGSFVRLNGENGDCIVDSRARYKVYEPMDMSVRCTGDRQCSCA